MLLLPVKMIVILFSFLVTCKSFAFALLFKKVELETDFCADVL